MADENGHANGNGKESRGVQAYRWMVTGGIAVIGLLLMRVLADIDKTAGKVDRLSDSFIETRGTTESRMNAHADRFRANDERWQQQYERDRQQDTKVEAIQLRVWTAPQQQTAPAPSHPAPTTPSILPYPR